MNILVTGGAGYIGSVTVRKLLKGNNVVVVDDLSKGHLDSLPKGITFYKSSIADRKIETILAGHMIDSVVHFAASIEVGESQKNPLKYFNNNLHNSVALLNSCIKCGVKRFVYSSTAAVYGNPRRTPIKEEDRKEPTNNYGLSKLLFEKVLEEYSKNHPIDVIALRYFNAAGADNENDIGEDHDPESHLIPIILQVAAGKKNEIKIFGNDYPTKDGTCIRDYIHVLDLADAHVLALKSLGKKVKGFEAFNLGSGKGFSVKEIVETARKITGKEIKASESRRRDGDPAVLLASPSKAKRTLGWKPTSSNVKQIINDAWEWHSRHPKGYRK